MAAMILGVGRAPGKVILFGEHAVVYGRPALAVPVTQVQAEASVEAGALGSGLVIWAADLGEEIAVHTAPADQPLATAARLTLAKLELPEPDWRVTVRSTIPIASGMGSGAAVSVAIVRALADAAGRQIGKSANRQIGNTQYAIRSTQYAFAPADVSAFVYEVEKLHHGTPSGVDNTVIAFGQPVYFVRDRPPQPFPIGRPFMLAIADSGIASPTKIAVGDVQRAWEQDRARFEWLFSAVAVIVEDARKVISHGEVDKLGQLMDANHILLRQIGVSCPELNALAVAAGTAGALGAKLSGGGRGGNLIALVTEETAPRVADALRAAGAVRVIVTEVGSSAQ